MDHLSRIIQGLQLFQQQNRSPVVEEPAQAFEKAVNDWHSMQQLVQEVKKLLKPLEAEERKARDGIAESLATFYGADLKEGVNNYELSNLRVLKYTHKVDRKIDNGLVAVAREAYTQADDKPELPFDDLLRVKYELAATPYKKVTGPNAKLAVSRMITSKPAAPTLTVE